MKLNADFLLTPIGEEFMLIPTGSAALRFHGVVKLNDSAAFIIRRFQSETDADAIVEAMAAKYEGTREQFERALDNTLTQLRSIGAIE